MPPTFQRVPDNPLRGQYPAAIFPLPRTNAGARARASSATLSNVSRPLLDRIYRHIEVPALAYENRAEPASGRPKCASECFEHGKYCSGVASTTRAMDDSGERTLDMAVHRMGLNARAPDRILKIARAIADLFGSEAKLAKHVVEATRYRSPDRSDWS